MAQILQVDHIMNAKDRVKQLNSKQNDLLHLLEDLDLNAVQMVKVAKQLRELRRERRYWRELTILIDKVGIEAVKGMAAWFDCKDMRKQKYIKESKDSALKLL